MWISTQKPSLKAQIRRRRREPFLCHYVIKGLLSAKSLFVSLMWCPESAAVYGAHFTEFNYYATRFQTACGKLCSVSSWDCFACSSSCQRVNRKLETATTKCNRERLLVTLVENDSRVSISFRSMTSQSSSARKIESNRGKLSWAVVDLMKWRFHTLLQLHLWMHSTSMLSSNFSPFVLCSSSGVRHRVLSESWKLLQMLFGRSR